MASSLSFMNILHPGFIMIIMGLVVLVLPDKARKVAYIAAPVLATLSLFALNANSSLKYSITNSLVVNFIKFDQLAFIFLVAFCIIAVIATIYAVNTSSKNKLEMAAGLIYAGCNMGVVLAADCISLLVFWELAALSSTYIVYARRTRKSTRAAFRYLLVHAFGGGMLLFGLMWYMFKYGIALDSLAGMSGEPLFWVVLIGVGINAAMPPINSWMPDAYPESTIGGTVFLGSYTTKAAIYLLIRLFAGTEWLVWMGVFMAVYGVLMALLENDLRRLLSYHIMSQLGYMVAALAIGNSYGIDGAAAHAFSNIMYKGVLLMAAGAIIYATGKRKISELGGMGKKMPVTAACFMIASLAIAGVPFLNGFASKALVMHAVEELPAAYWLLTAASVGTWLSITLKINWFVFWKPTDKDVEIVNPIPMNMKIGMILGSAACVITGMFPNLVYNITPFATDGDPFTLHHIFEYIILFIGATLVFYLFRKRMEPHDELSLDFDWFYRRPLNTFILFLSKGIHAVYNAFSDATIAGLRATSAKMSNPYILTKDHPNDAVRDYSFENEGKKIGDVIIIVMLAMIVMLLVFAKAL